MEETQWHVMDCIILHHEIVENFAVALPTILLLPHTRSSNPPIHTTICPSLPGSSCTGCGASRKAKHGFRQEGTTRLKVPMARATGTLGGKIFIF